MKMLQALVMEQKEELAKLRIEHPAAVKLRNAAVEQMTRDFSTRAFIICSTAALRTLTAAGCSMRSFANSSFCSMTRACGIFIEELLFSCSFFSEGLVLLKSQDFAGRLLL